MAWTQGDSYACPQCGCEVTVTKAPTGPGQHGDQAPTCCCGHTMQKKS